MFTTKETSTEVLNIRLTKSEKEALQKLAKEEGFTTSSMVKICINYYMEKKKQLDKILSKG